VVGAADLTLHAIGTNFSPGAVIVFDGANYPTTRVSATELTTTVRPTTATAGAKPVRVRNPDGGITTPVNFTFTT
jgi:hypothetical protein